MLVVDDDSVLLRALQRVLAVQGFEVDTALDGRSALSQLESNDYDVLLLDLRLGNVDALEVHGVAQRTSRSATIVHSAHIDLRTAVLATRAGVQDVMQKPVPEDVLTARIRELAAQRRADLERAPAEIAHTVSDEPLQRLVGDSAKACELRDHVRRIAPFRDVSVLIQGATGTGKELVAQALHQLTCPGEPFVSVNCAAVPEQLFESELFGHEAGAFTSARSSRIGLLEEAGQGTLFLDEIGEMPLVLQAKLLRVLEIRQFRRVGGTRTRVFGARVVSATNRPLSSSTSGALREDLFFRLAGYAIRTPSLAERAGDIPGLARYFLAEFKRRHGQVECAEFRGAALSALQAHQWPGNVRELRAVIENAAIIARGGMIEQQHVEHALQARGSASIAESALNHSPTIQPEPGLSAGEELSASRPPRPPGAQLRASGSLPNLQRDIILRAFEEAEHNLSRAAIDLGIPRSTLRARLKRYGVR